MAGKDGEGTALWAAVDTGAAAGFDFLTLAVSAACLDFDIGDGGTMAL